MRAFQYAKDYSPAKSAHGPDYVEKREFRILLVALRQRFEYLQAFRRIDSGNDGRVDLPEFLAARAAIERWVGPMEDPEVEFKKIDSDQGGQILFEEFCKWSIGKNLDLDDDDESDDNERAQPTSQREEPEHSVSPTEGDGLATHTVGATNEAVAEQQEVAENPHLKEVLEKIVET